MWHRNKHRHFSSKRQNRSTRKMLAQHNSPARMIPESTSGFFSKNWARHRKITPLKPFRFSLSPFYLPLKQAHKVFLENGGALWGRQTMMPFISVKYWDPELKVPLGKYVNPGWSQTMRRLTRIRLFVVIHTPELPPNRLLIRFTLCQQISPNGFYFKQFHSPAFPSLNLHRQRGASALLYFY